MKDRPLQSPRPFPDLTGAGIYVFHLKRFVRRLMSLSLNAFERGGQTLDARTLVMQVLDVMLRGRRMDGSQKGY